MKVKSIAECCNTFDLHIAINGLNTNFWSSFLSGCLTGFTVTIFLLIFSTCQKNACIETVLLRTYNLCLVDKKEKKNSITLSYLRRPDCLVRRHWCPPRGVLITMVKPVPLFSICILQHYPGLLIKLFLLINGHGALNWS